MGMKRKWPKKKVPGPPAGFYTYAEGWNARCRNEEYNLEALPSWRFGWEDCDKKKPEDRIEFK